MSCDFLDLVECVLLTWPLLLKFMLMLKLMSCSCLLRVTREVVKRRCTAYCAHHGYLHVDLEMCSRRGLSSLFYMDF